jgi:SAM-dependent methyltransferase
VIHQSILSSLSTKILDLGCGPGLYTHRLANMGHECTGIDFSPASIAYADEKARVEKLKCTYIQQDIRSADYGHGYGLVMLIFGEFNVFRPTEARTILQKAYQALSQNGILLLEVHTFTYIQAFGKQPLSWYSTKNGLFSNQPHLCLTENCWNDDEKVATKRYFILDATTGQVARHGESLKAYSNEQYQVLLEECGFKSVCFYPSLQGDVEQSQGDFVVISCQKC